MSTMKSDRQLRQDVLEELEFEPSLHEIDIGISVTDGVVTLSGTVPSYVEKRAAEQAALRVHGVKAVAELIDVHLDGTSLRSDTAIAQTVVAAIESHVQLPHDELQIKVEDGIVVLEGDVDWHYQKEKALEAVRPLEGVRGIVNLIHVRVRPIPSGVRERIRRALERTADEDAATVTVDVDDAGCVTLGGSVRTWLEREDAVRAAWSVPGVTEVVNQVAIRPYAYAL